MAVGRQRESPTTVRARATLTGFEMHATTAAPRREADEPPRLVLRIRRCSVSMSTENHLVGGITRRFDTEFHGEEGAARHQFTVQDPAVLRSEAACHAAVRLMLPQLPQLAGYYGHRAADFQFWDQFVPPTLVASILAGTARLDRVAAGFGDLGASGAAHRSYTCDFSMRVHVTSVYSEAKQLLLSCEDEDTAARARAGADILGGQCPICMEELTEANSVIALPVCSHAFHRGCLLKWFQRAATCPSCRRDMMHYLPQMFRVWHMLK